MSAQLKAASLATAERIGRPIRYLPSARTSKEAIARQIAQADGITEGLICVLTCVEPCMSYTVRRDRPSKKLVLTPALRKCLHLYHYWMDRNFGLMHGRIQTWFPFSIQVCLNGRSWLARQMDRLGLGYQRRENCFVWLEDVKRTQRLMDKLLRLNWPDVLGRLARRINPVLPQILRGYRVEYYWSAYESEWASDVMFRTPEALAQIYPSLLRGVMSVFSSETVMRFLGKKLHGNFLGEVVSDCRRRPEGVRVKHSVKSNSVKMYDKQGSVLRVETTINDPRDLKVYRAREGDSGGIRDWRRMRKGVVDLRRRAEVSQGCNGRYYDALAALDTSRPLREVMAPICRPTKLGDARMRAMRPWSEEDLALLRAINRGEHVLGGFRNRDVAALLYPEGRKTPSERRQASARISYRLRLLRAHRIIKKIPHTHRYQVTAKGRQIVTSILQSQEVTLNKLTEIAA